MNYKELKFALKQFIIYRILNTKLLKPKAWYLKSDELDKYQHISEAVNYLRVAELPAVFFEFGCSSGRTYSAALLAAKYFHLPLDAYAFDSFEGLPETNKVEDGIFKAGSFSTSLSKFKKIVKKRTKVELGEDRTIVGFYENSLTVDLKRSLPNEVGFVHIDVDLYSSTVTVLEFIKDILIDGTVILFDDWYCFPPGNDMGEKKALGEFAEKYPQYKFDEWKNYSGFGKSFFVSIDK
jgi:O-methyltransferase